MLQLDRNCCRVYCQWPSHWLVLCWNWVLGLMTQIPYWHHIALVESLKLLSTELTNTRFVLYVFILFFCHFLLYACCWFAIGRFSLYKYGSSHFEKFLWWSLEWCQNEANWGNWLLKNRVMLLCQKYFYNKYSCILIEKFIFMLAAWHVTLSAAGYVTLL